MLLDILRKTHPGFILSIVPVLSFPGVKYIVDDTELKPTDFLDIIAEGRYTDLRIIRGQDSLLLEQLNGLDSTINNYDLMGEDAIVNMAINFIGYVRIYHETIKSCYT